MAKFRSARRKKKIQTQFYDYNLLAVVILLLCFGLIMLYSASAYETSDYFYRQAAFSACSILLAVVASRFDYHTMINFAPVLYIVSLFLMLLVRFSPLGYSAGGAQRWLTIAGVRFQPAEIAKIAVVLFMPYAILRMGKKVKRLKAVLVLLGIGLLQAAAVYVLTDNLSTAVIIAGVTAIVVFVAHPKTRPFLLFALVLVVAVTAMVFILDTYFADSDSFRIQRVIAWLHPESNLSSDRYQVLQGLYAIGSGGLFGAGLGNGTQKLTSIPEAQNDMIFAIICEELGLFGAILLLVLFAYLLYRLLFIAQNAPDLYGTLVVTGIFGHVALQVILNICVVLNLIPTTGVTLPFVSYGGTSIIFLMAEMGIALSVARNIQFSGEDEEAIAAQAEEVRKKMEKEKLRREKRLAKRRRSKNIPSSAEKRRNRNPEGTFSAGEKD